MSEYDDIRDDLAWEGTTTFGSGVARCLIRMAMDWGSGRAVKFDPEALARKTEFTVKQIEAAINLLIRRKHVRIGTIDGLGNDALYLLALCPSRIRWDAEVKAKAAGKAERRAAREASRPKRASISEDIRAAVYVRDGGRCQECGSTQDLTMDHKIPWSQGGPDTVDNLRVLCRPCNSRRGAPRATASPATTA